jgi:3-hydroxyacyl-CoA dehydrogenase
MAQVNDLVSVETRGRLAVIRIDNPPVNALSRLVRDGLYEAVSRADRDPTVSAIVIACAGRTFVAGADIREFGLPPAGRSAREVMERIEQASKPVIAALHGTALGGGLELALACHYRVAHVDARAGLPEVKLGLLPGAGGTQRLPRLIGVARALELMVSGDQLGARKAYELGVLDEIAEEDLEGRAASFAERVLAARRPLRRVRDDRGKLADGTEEFLAAFRRSLGRTHRGLPAPAKIVDCVEAAVRRTFEEGMAIERAAFLELRDSPESRALRYCFFAEREAAKVPDVGDEVSRRPIAKIGVIGAGKMGGGIAMNFLDAGKPVVLVEKTREALDRGLAAIRKNYERSASKGKLAQSASEERMRLITASLELEAIGDCDVVIEAIYENMALKKDLFGRLDRVARRDAILATNTSFLNVDEIAACTPRPQDVIGLHFFGPANLMKLLEVVRGKHTARDVVATSMALGRSIGKVPVLVGVCRGFVGNRTMMAQRAQALALIQEGPMPWDVDRVLEEFGMPMGPFAMSDLAGLDIGWSAETSQGATFLRDRLCELGRRGQESGAGYYSYEVQTRARSVDPVVQELVAELARKSGRPQRMVTDAEILERCLLSCVNEGAKILEEGIVLRASDIDVVWVNGYGWPKYRGGPMFWADRLGLDHVIDRLEHYERELGPGWRPAAVLRRMAQQGERFVV